MLEWLTIAQATEYLQVSRTTLYRLVERGTLPSYRIADTKQKRFKKTDLDQLMILDGGEILEDNELSEDDNE